MTPSKLYQALLKFETDGSNAPDARRVIGQERQSLHVCIERVALLRTAKPTSVRPEPALADERAAAQEALDTRASEAERVARMWGAL